jgi:exonuclease III
MKLNELRANAHTHEPDIICITETWFHKESDVNIDNYDIYRRDRNNDNLEDHHGGVCIYVKKSIKCVETNIKQLNSIDIEQIWVSLEFNNKRVLVGCMYRPPSTSTVVNDKLLFSIKEAKKATQNRKFTDLLINGDFNYNTINWTIAYRFLETLNDCFMEQCITQPTFQKANYELTNTLDLVIVEDAKKIKRCYKMILTEWMNGQTNGH